jgi:uncharacterized protein (TIGR03067 family)
MKRPFALLTLVFPLVIAPALAVEDTEELKKFNGSWKVLQAEKEGAPLPEKDAKALKVTIKDGTMTIKDGNREDVAKLKVDPSKKPGAIDFVLGKDDKIAPGIYAFEGDGLKICWTIEGAERPKEFTSKKEPPTHLFVLSKEK